MKDLKEYILENVEYENDKYGNVLITLLRHENLDLSTIDEKTFINEMYSDIQKAVKEYCDLVTPYKASEKSIYLERCRKEAEKYVEKKYKRNSNKQKYIDNAIKNFEESWEKHTTDAKKIFFDIVPDPTQMGSGYGETLYYDTDKKYLKKTYEVLENNKYFRKGIGWAFKYQARDKDNPCYSFRPYVDILMNESDKAEQLREKEIHDNAVANFYKDSNYWGD